MIIEEIFMYSLQIIIMMTGWHLVENLYSRNGCYIALLEFTSQASYQDPIWLKKSTQKHMSQALKHVSKHIPKTFYPIWKVEALKWKFKNNHIYLQYDASLPYKWWGEPKENKRNDKGRYKEKSRSKKIIPAHITWILYNPIKYFSKEAQQKTEEDNGLG